MSKIKWYKRDPNAALTGMMMLSLEERGAYNTILDLIYSHGGGVLNDDRFLAGWMRCDLRVWKRIKTRLLDLKKLYEAGDLLRSSAADVHIDDALLRITSAEEAGRASARKRESQNKENKDLAPTPVQRDLQLTTTTSTTTSTTERVIEANSNEFALTPDEGKIEKKSKRATPLPDDWRLPIPWGEWAMNEERMTRDEIIRQARTFHDWAIANGVVKKNWEAAWRNWIRRSTQFKMKEFGK